MEAQQVFICTACNKFATVMDVMLIAHQVQCDNIDEEKQEYRLALLPFYFREEDIPRVLELAKTAFDKQQG